jgi:glutathione S-transferase
MQLYWAPRTRSLKAIWMLEETGLPYDLNRIDLQAGEQTSATYRAINPMMKVPAIVDGPTKVAESGAILAYLAEQSPKAKLAPSIDHPRRGDYLRWLFFSAGCVEAAFVEKFTQIKLPTVSAGWGDFERVLDVIEAGLAPGPWLLGELFTAADVAIGSDLRFGMDIFKIIEPRPAFRAYVDRCVTRPAFVRALEIDAKG